MRNRRRFLAQLTAVLGLGATTTLARAASPQHIELQRSPVAGFQYHQGEAVWSQLGEDAALDLVREPDNRHDPRAVRVDWQGHKLGYVPRIDNAAVSHLLDHGQRVTARIVALRQDDNPWSRIEFAVYLQA